MASFAEGIRMMLDGQHRDSRAGLEVYLRVQNFASEGDFQEVGVPYVVNMNSGFTDIPIDPPPQVVDVSLHNIGMSGGRLQFGARYFHVSHTFVLKIRQDNPSIPNDRAVWRNWDGNTPVLGFMYEGVMHSIEDISHREAGGETISWKITCNRVDVDQDAGAQQPLPIP